MSAGQEHGTDIAVRPDAQVAIPEELEAQLAVIEETRSQLIVLAGQDNTWLVDACMEITGGDPSETAALMRRAKSDPLALREEQARQAHPRHDLILPADSKADEEHRREEQKYEADQLRLRRQLHELEDEPVVPDVLHQATLEDWQADLGTTEPDEIRAVQQVLAAISGEELLLARHEGLLIEVRTGDETTPVEARKVRGAAGLRELLARAEEELSGRFFWRRIPDPSAMTQVVGQLAGRDIQHCWEAAQPSREAMAAVMAAQWWDGIPDLKDVLEEIDGRIPEGSPDPSQILPAISAGQGDSGRIGRMEGLLAAETEWCGTLLELAVVLGWEDSVQALRSYLGSMSAALETWGLTVGPTGRKTQPERRAIWRVARICASNPSDPSDPSDALPPGKTSGRMPGGSFRDPSGDH